LNAGKSPLTAKSFLTGRENPKKTVFAPGGGSDAASVPVVRHHRDFKSTRASEGTKL
jgi:hypothetical protein